MGSEETTAGLEGMRLPAGVREALVNDPGFLRDLVQIVLNRVLDAEISEHLQAERYQRSEERVGYRNGSRPRQLNTRVGRLQLLIPMDREGTFQTRLFERHQRSEKALVGALMELAAAGRHRGREHQEGQGHHRDAVRYQLQQEHRETPGGRLVRQARGLALATSGGRLPVPGGRRAGTRCYGAAGDLRRTRESMWHANSAPTRCAPG